MSERRKHERAPTLSGARLEVAGETRLCLIHDLSDGGALIAFTGPKPAVGAAARLTIPAIGVFDGAIVRAKGRYVGFRFADEQRIGTIPETYIADVVALIE